MSTATAPQTRGRAALKSAAEPAAPAPSTKPEDDLEDDTDPAAKAKAEEEAAAKAKADADAKAASASSASRTPQVMSTAATLAELKAKFPDSTADFREECVIGNLTMEQATDKFLNVLRQQAKQPAPTPRKAGNDPVGTSAARQGGGGASVGDDPKSQIDQLVTEKMKATNKPRHLAHKEVMEENPELRKAWIESHNQQHRATSPRR